LVFIVKTVYIHAKIIKLSEKQNRISNDFRPNVTFFKQKKTCKAIFAGLSGVNQYCYSVRFKAVVEIISRSNSKSFWLYSVDIATMRQRGLITKQRGTYFVA
jgi:hypothetical protein